MPEETKVLEYETDDLALAAWYLMKGVRMTRHRAGRDKMVWYFEDADGVSGSTRCADLLTEFLNSECKRFDSFCRDLKKMLRKQLREA